MAVSFRSIGGMLLAVLLPIAACERADGAEGHRRSHEILLADGSDGNWAAYGGGYHEMHYSPLDELDGSNVSRLGLAWAIDLPTRLNTHSAPLEIEGVVYYATGLSIVSAADARTGKVLWTYDPKVADVAGQKLREAWGIRGIAWWNGKVITGTQDGRLIALNAADGHPVWSVQTTLSPDDGRYITGAPRVFNGKVVIGHGGADFAPIRGYVTAYDAESGKKLLTCRLSADQFALRKRLVPGSLLIAFV
jgi:quinohemoprotein ethanol dehydrogenase